MYIRQIAAELFHTDGVVTKLRVAFCNFANAPMKLHPSTTSLRRARKQNSEQHSNRKM